MFNLCEDTICSQQPEYLSCKITSNNQHWAIFVTIIPQCFFFLSLLCAFMKLIPLHSAVKSKRYISDIIVLFAADGLSSACEDKSTFNSKSLKNKLWTLLDFGSLFFQSLPAPEAGCQSTELLFNPRYQRLSLRSRLLVQWTTQQVQYLHEKFSKRHQHQQQGHVSKVGHFYMWSNREWFVFGASCGHSKSCSFWG